MTKKRAAALAAFLRQSADTKSPATKSPATKVTNPHEPPREGMLLLDVADAAERLPADDPRLSQLAAKRRFVTAEGHVRFVGSGIMMRDVVRSAAAGDLGEGQQALDAIILAALKGRPPRGAG